MASAQTSAHAIRTALREVDLHNPDSVEAAYELVRRQGDEAHEARQTAVLQLGLLARIALVIRSANNPRSRERLGAVWVPLLRLWRALLQSEEPVPVAQRRVWVPDTVRILLRFAQYAKPGAEREAVVRCFQDMLTDHPECLPPSELVPAVAYLASKLLPRSIADKDWASAGELANLCLYAVRHHPKTLAREFDEWKTFDTIATLLETPHIARGMLAHHLSLARRDLRRQPPKEQPKTFESAVPMDGELDRIPWTAEIRE